MINLSGMISKSTQLCLSCIFMFINFKSFLLLYMCMTAFSFDFLFFLIGRQGDVVVGLRLPDHSDGEPNDSRWQQHLEQHPHITCRTGAPNTTMTSRVYITCHCLFTSLVSLCFQAMASTEDKAYEIMRELDVDYVLVIFGGLTGYSSDGKNFIVLSFVSLSSDS